MKYEPNNIYNVDCYEAIKDIPDKSIDLVYIDIPYLIGKGGTSKSEIASRIVKEQYQLGSQSSEKQIKSEIAKLKHLMETAKSKSEYEKYHCLHSNALNKLNLMRADIVNGIDYKLFDELCRVMKSIYIYIYGAAKNKCTIS